ncbi:hypothetical protein [Sphaerisporangium perillae]|uniref:hypothetical protein n=1 Tax=Sphaerisporangium perillae TaxID=2935860 RepID=UPI00200DB62D|nr:hypothetical protein [Sphaerisporangium perillae]
MTWSRMELSDSAVVEVGTDRYAEYVIVMSEDKRQFTEDIGEYAEDWVEAIAGEARRVRKSKPRRVTIGGMPGLQYDMQGDVEGGRVGWVLTSIDGAAHYHNIVVTTTASRVQANSRRLRAIVATFRETGR